MKNRLIALVLVLIMTFSLCACGAQGGSTESDIDKMISEMSTEQKLAQMMVSTLR